MKVGDYISVTYHDGREFVGMITILENQCGTTNGDVMVWSDGVHATVRTMIRIVKDNGNYQSLWLDKCLSINVRN